jgi:hypothetical protein
MHPQSLEANHIETGETVVVAGVTRLSGSPFRPIHNPLPTMTTTNILGPSKWATYMTDIYRSRKSPQPLGTVLFEEIEARAQDTLNRYHGKAQYDG